MSTESLRPQDDDWWHFARCREEALRDPRVHAYFDYDKRPTVTEFNDKGEEVKMSRARIKYLATEICKRCVVSDECLQEALDKNETEGIRGGLDPNERAAMKRINQRRLR